MEFFLTFKLNSPFINCGTRKMYVSFEIIGYFPFTYFVLKYKNRIQNRFRFKLFLCLLHFLTFAWCRHFIFLDEWLSEKHKIYKDIWCCFKYIEHKFQTSDDSTSIDKAHIKRFDSIKFDTRLIYTEHWMSIQMDIKSYEMDW